LIKPFSHLPGVRLEVEIGGFAAEISRGRDLPYALHSVDERGYADEGGTDADQPRDDGARRRDVVPAVILGD